MFNAEKWAKNRIRGLKQLLQDHKKRSEAELDNIEHAFRYYCDFTNGLQKRDALFATSVESMAKFWQTQPAQEYLQAQKRALSRGVHIERICVFSSQQSFEHKEIQKILGDQLRLLPKAEYSAAFMSDPNHPQTPISQQTDHALFLKRDGGGMLRPVVGVLYRDTTFCLSVFRDGLPELSIPIAKPYILTSNDRLAGEYNIHQGILSKAVPISIDPDTNKVILGRLIA